MIIDALPIGVVLVDAEGFIRGQNPSALELLGTSAASIEGRSLEEALPHLTFPSDRSRITREIRDAQGGRTLEICRVSLAGGCQGCPTALIIRDYTEVELLKDQLRNTITTKNSYENILNSISEGIEVVDRDGRLIFMNRSQEEIDEMRRSDALYRHVSEVYRLAPESSLMVRAMRTGKPIINEHQTYVTKYGKMVNIICTAVPLYEDSNMVGAVAITKDYSMARRFSDKWREMEMKIQGSTTPVAEGSSPEATYTFEDIAGQDPSFLRVIREARQASGTDSPILIHGETGTGKELFAQSIHRNSPRAGEPFMAINCAAIPEGLLEGILFGTSKGAFTGAVDRRGLFEEASRGTIFLDEINSMQPFLQSKLLRVLEEGTIRRVGDTKERRVTPRIISSMNVDPLKAVEKGTIRQDLFYRLGVVYLGLPPLRRRLEDIPELTERFIKKYNRRFGRQVKSASAAVMALFLKHPWPGNVRELEHCVESSLNMVAPGEECIEVKHLPYYFLHPATAEEAKPPIEHETFRIAMDDAERAFLNRALRAHQGNVSRAARSLGLSRQNLQYRLKKMGLRLEEFRQG
jgi:arginine utilization regulatory protein